ncbi:ABC transporter permease [Kribbella sp. NBC_00889]|uniref:ABC transporter permease n=1 Tax=Kribbella sp. NBC_00889 TaxID=2975974 RepID=UPI00386B8B9D|nr:ABC transporter permease [Kribbella sp. NBC_00889]
MRADVREGWRRIWVVALREIRERGGSRAYRISTVLGVILVVAIILVPSLLEKSTTYHVGMSGAAPDGVVTALVEQARAVNHGLEVTRYPSVADGERAVRDKKIDVLLVDGTRVEWRTESDSTLTAAIASAVQAVHVRDQADRLGISSDKLAQLLVPVSLTSRTLGAAHTADKDANTVGFIAVGVMYVAISFYAGFVLTGVVQEKANRVAEVLLARMPAREILAGKVVGIGVVGLAQLAVIGGAAVTTAAFRGGADAPSIPGDVLAWTCLWFVLGYLFYSVLYAAIGATTSRIEDAQAAIAPITGLMLLSYFGVIYAEENPDAVVTILLSYFPPTAPVVMTYRVAVHAVPGWQMMTAATFMVIAMWGLIRLAGRIYSGALLRFGGRVPLRDLVRTHE